MAKPEKNRILLFCAVGLLSGVLSGFFGIGGGSVIVPVLMMVGYSQRTAAATSLLAILPTAASGVVAYLRSGQIDYVPALLLAIGVVIGAQFGTKALAVLPERTLRWSFAVFMLLMAILQFVLTPGRGGEIELHFISGALLLVLGVFTGFLSGLLGIGGGFVIITGLIFFFGGSDLAARGTSLLTMIPGTISGTVRNVKNRLTDVRAGLIIGLCAAVTAPLGKWCVEQLTPKAAAVSVGLFMLFLVVRSLYTAFKAPKEED